MLNDVMLSILKQIVFKQKVVMLIVIMLTVVIESVIMLSVIHAEGRWVLLSWVSFNKLS